LNLAITEDDGGRNPVPGDAGMALLAIAGLGIRRRRRR
jgi:MYXO-CTERM domain-containing protein